MHRPVALITGGRRGIGRAIAERFLLDGWTVALNDIDAHALEATAADLKTVGSAITAHPADVTDREQVRKMIGDVQVVHGSIDVLVLNAAVVWFAGLLEIEPDRLREMVDANVLGSFHCLQSVAEGWVAEERGGTVVAVTSVSAFQARQGHLAYGTSKSAMEMMAKVAALELAPHGIRVNCVAPGGPIMTEMVASQIEAVPDFDEQVRRSNPIGRPGEPSEVAEVVRFLSGPESSYMTGSVVVVDGGVSLGRS